MFVLLAWLTTVSYTFHLTYNLGYKQKSSWYEVSIPAHPPQNCSQET